MQALMATEDEIIGPINIGNPGEFTMWELALKVIELTDSRSQILQMPLPQDDPKQRRPDITKAQSLLNWNPTINLEQGLIKTIDYFRKVV
jgi:UDP-glucuronate decarboxylase